MPVADSPFSFLHRTVKILAVDDDEDVLDLYSALFSLYGIYDVTCAVSATAAHALDGTKPFHFPASFIRCAA